jgi:AmiR/NasT family two-component response regulator
MWHARLSASYVAACPRIIVALPNEIECATIAEWLSSNRFEPVRRTDARSAAREMHARDFDLLVADATFAMRDGLLAVSRKRNPSMPIVVIGDDAEADLRDAASRHAMYLRRPLERATIVCTVMMAIMEGRPTRRSERKIASRFEAIVNDVPSHIIDASYHGLRLQMPAQGMSALPRHFAVRVPLIGVAVTVQRVWARSVPGQLISCGAALSANRPAIEQRWRGFVDMLPVLGTSAT